MSKEAVVPEITALDTGNPPVKKANGFEMNQIPDSLIGESETAIPPSGEDTSVFELPKVTSHLVQFPKKKDSEKKRRNKKRDRRRKRRRKNKKGNK